MAYMNHAVMFITNIHKANDKSVMTECTQKNPLKSRIKCATFLEIHVCFEKLIPYSNISKLIIKKTTIK